MKFNNLTKKTILSLSAFSILLVAGCSGCGGGKVDQSKNIVKSRSMSDPDMLNPINLSSADGRYISGLIFMTLLGTDPETYEITPALVINRPTITEIADGEYKGGLKLDFEIRPEAVWDNGTPITGHDYAFTIKTILNPLMANPNLGPYYNWLADVQVDKTNPKKFSVIAKDKYFKTEEFAGGNVIPKYIYDANGLSDKYSIIDLNSNEKRNAMKSNKEVKTFADHFNSEKFQREKGFVVGCGPYEFTEWVTGQKIVLTKKKNWWGDKIKDNRNFIAYPSTIVFKMIKDPNSAVTALKDGQIDDFHGIDGKLYEDLITNETAKKKLNMSHPSIFAFSYMGFNMQSPKLSDIRVRQAIGYCINKPELNKVIGFNRNTIVETFVHPEQKHYNGDLYKFEFNIEKAKKLLDEAGWIDTDGDQIRDKVIGGKKVKLSIDYKYPAANKGREQTGILIKEDLKKAGIELNLNGREWSVYLQDMDNKDFEMTYGAFTMSSTMSDPYQQWHTASAKAGGDNTMSFGNAETDKLIEEIRSELNEEIRIQKYKLLQQKIHDEVPCIFMFIPANRMAVNKKYEVKTTLIDPGYLYNEFKLTNTQQ